MALQLSTDVRNARLNAIETVIGTAAVLKIRTGAAPANCGTADSGTVLAEMTLPTDWMADAASGSKGIAGTWQVNGEADGVAGHFRIYESTGTTCHLQGVVGTDLVLDNANIAIGQEVTITAFTLNDNNA